MADNTTFESDKQNILPTQHFANTNAYYEQQPAPTQTIVHVNNTVPSPPDYFIFSIFVTICCCLPFGIVALVKSSEVRTRARIGDIEGAQLSSRQAKTWSFAGFFTGIGIVVAVVAIYVIIIIAAANSY
ncbi:putative proline-rich transmembrane protein 1 [Apostichopus japonicus]|uniref:Putative proline-rich transmembrane protein 1 n=1 Tax=Stichopus japonicus TaxID=307972 RepID=A0A2G8JVL6_STIJA|nr:putative proline-rich transmembrane protein 1 [Apostichopus japonicus]